MKILITNRRLEKFGGSELVALELAEELQARNHEVLLWTHILLDPLKSEIKVPVTSTRPQDLSQFDVIWTHHNMILNYKPRDSQRIYFNHMSSYVDLEYPQNAEWEEATATRIFANSPETQAKMKSLGLSRCEVYPNPAPASFDKSDEGRYGLFVSNHRPQLLKMFAISLGCPNKFIGENDGPGRFMRVTPELMAGAHFVVTNGKTCQYALRARKPIFLFDHMGGPGWLTEDNLKRAMDFNFSGRCSRENNKLSELNKWKEAKPVPSYPEELKLEYWLKELDL